jgi:hypothetical protein
LTGPNFPCILLWKFLLILLGTFGFEEFSYEDEEEEVEEEEE